MRGNIKVVISGVVTLIAALYLLSDFGSSSSSFAAIHSSLSSPAEPPQEMNAFRAVFVTVPNIEVGKKLAHGLVSSKLAACVNIIPQVTSVYEWEGKINEDSELILMIKSQEHLFEELQKFVKENHPYDVPEVIALPIQQGSQPYLDWILQNTKKKNS